MGRCSRELWPVLQGSSCPAPFHSGGNLALQFAPAGRQSGGFQNISERRIIIQREQKWASFHLGRNLALQFAPAGPQSGGFQEVSERWIVIQREQECKAISVRRNDASCPFSQRIVRLVKR
jgi:hypothetical protein